MLEKETLHKIVSLNEKWLDIISTYKSVVDKQKIHHAETKKRAWEIMGRGVIRENEFGDATEVALNINDWRELCEAVNFGV